MLFPPSVEFAPAYQVAPPVAVDLLTDKKFALTIPVDFDRVCDAAVTEPMVSTLPGDCPVAFQSVNVFVVPAVNKIEHPLVTVCDAVMFENVFAPVMVNAPAPPWSSVQL